MSHRDTYNEKLELAKTAIISEITKLITDKWYAKFDSWLYQSAVWEFRNIYDKILKEQFDTCVTEEVTTSLGYPANMILLQLKAFRKRNKHACLDDNIKDVLDSLEFQFQHPEIWFENLRASVFGEEPNFRDCLQQ